MNFAGPIVGRAAKRIWTPYNTGIDRLALLWDADDYVRMVDDGSGVISSWKDRISGVAFTASTTARPTWAADSFGDGYAGVTFDGVANRLVTTTGFPTGAIDLELWLLVQVVAGSGTVSLVDIGGTGNTTFRAVRRTAAGLANVTDGTTSLSGTGSNTFTGPQLIRAYWAGTTMGFDRNGGTALFSTTFANASIGATRLSLGAANATVGAGFAPVTVRRMAVVRGQLTASEVERFQFYNADDVSISQLLATGHRYYFGNSASVTPPFQALPAYFKPSDSAAATAAGYKIWLQSPPPASPSVDETGFAYFPMTDSSSQQLDRIASSTWSGGLWWYQWDPRDNIGHTKVANPIYPSILLNGKQCRTEYPTLAMAIAAAKVAAMYVMGASSADYNAVAAVAGFDVSTQIKTHAQLVAAPASFFTGASITGPGKYNVWNGIWLPDTKLTVGAQGIILDHEVQDSRTPADTQTELLDFASTVHGLGYKLFIYTNRLDGTGGAPYNTFDATNLPAILAAVDYFGILMVNGADFASSFAAQLALLGPNPPMSKVVVIFDMAASLADATTLRSLMVANGIKNLSFFTDLQPIGGSDPLAGANPKINMLAFGV